MLTAQPSTYASKSDALRRILNMDDPNSLMSTVVQVGRKSFSSLSSGTLVNSSRFTPQPPGLGNYDSSCFQNSILQALSSLKPLPAYLKTALAGPDSLAKDGGGLSSAETLRDFLLSLIDTRNNGTTLWTPNKLKSLDTWQQQDAQEYFAKILDEIDKEVAIVAKTQYRPAGLEVAAGARDDTAESQHSDDSGYQSLSNSSKSMLETQVLKNPLEGLVAQRVACVQCGHSEGLSMIPFNCLTLSLGNQQNHHNLYERLDSYTDLESIAGVECAKCTLIKAKRLLHMIVMRTTDRELAQEPLSRLAAVEEALEEEDFEEKTLGEKCKINKRHRVTTTKTKQMVIGRPPSSLAIHINRSVFDENTGLMFKNPADVRFPSMLDLGPWCIGSAGAFPSNLGNGSQTIQDGIEQWDSDPKSSMVSGSLEPSKLSGPIYELRAVITHQGRHENGHYVCYRKHPRQQGNLEADLDEKPRIFTEDQPEYEQGEGQKSEQINPEEDSRWWRLSDESVWEVDEETVLDQGGVFMLFYDCVDPDSILIAEHRDGHPMTLDGTETGGEFGIPETSTRSHGPKIYDRLHDTEIEYEPVEATETTVLKSERPSCSVQVNGFCTDKLSGDASISPLIPALGLDDHIDPTIPLRWPVS